MPTDPRKRQKKQERRTAKRKEKHHELVREKSTGLPERLAAATRYPVLHSWVTEDFWTEGMGWACLSRSLPNGLVAFAVFLVDRYCLGVKNVLFDVANRAKYDSEIARKMQLKFTSRELDPASLRKLVEDSVAYARSLGLHPHPDYEKARHLFGTIDASQSTEQFEFGKDGKPFFVGGPNDTTERCRRILRALEESCGPGGYNYMIPMSSRGQLLAEADPEEKARFMEEDDEDEADFNEPPRGLPPGTV